MSGQGSSSSDTVVRVEVYLDDASETVRVLTAPPFRFQLDTSSLEEGEHMLRLVRIDAAGGRRERRIPFRVRHEPAVEVRGLEDGATVSGRIDVDVVAPAAAAPPAAPARGPSPWLYIVSTVLILGGIWVFFMLVPMYSAIVGSSSSSGSQASAASGGGAAPPVNQQLLKTGEQVYSTDCASCHKPSGEGMPPTFPALAGNSFLSDPSAVVKRIYDGAGSMPSHKSYSATKLAAVATYVRNTWGNSYGGVSVEAVTKAIPELGSSGGSASQSSSTTSSGTGSAGSSSTSAPSSSSSSSSAPSSSSSSTSAPSSSSSSSSAPSASSSSTPPASSSSASGGAASSSAGTASSPTAAASSQAMQAGKKLYTSDCQSCHQPNGSGLPPTFPALAGNSFLADAGNVVERIFNGKGTMPSHPSYTAQDLANVATYIRNSFGNDYGPVSVKQVEQAVPKAAQ